MKLRPCIDIHDGQVKQIVGGSLRDDAGATNNYVSEQSAAYYANLYREKDLPGGHIILLNPVSDPMYEQDKAQALAALQAYSGGMQIGGGITPETAGEFLDAGASHVIVTSYVFRNGMLDRERLDAMIAAVGREHLVLDLSCKRSRETGAYMVVTDRWQKETTLAITNEILDDLSTCCDEFLIHAADVEGKRGGVETGLLEILGSWNARNAFPVTYAGGVHALSDVGLIAAYGKGTIDYTVGSALDLFGGSLSLDALIRV